MISTVNLLWPRPETANLGTRRVEQSAVSKAASVGGRRNPGMSRMRGGWMPSGVHCSRSSRCGILHVNAPGSPGSVLL